MPLAVVNAGIAVCAHPGQRFDRLNAGEILDPAAPVAVVGNAVHAVFFAVFDGERLGPGIAVVGIGDDDAGIVIRVGRVKTLVVCIAPHADRVPAGTLGRRGGVVPAERHHHTVSLFKVGGHFADQRSLICRVVKVGADIGNRNAGIEVAAVPGDLRPARFALNGVFAACVPGERVVEMPPLVGEVVDEIVVNLEFRGEKPLVGHLARDGGRIAPICISEDIGGSRGPAKLRIGAVPVFIDIVESADIVFAGR